MDGSDWLLGDQAVGEDTSKLKIMSWNVRGVAAEIDNFLEVLSQEIDWDVFLLQEFSSSYSTSK